MTRLYCIIDTMVFNGLPMPGGKLSVIYMLSQLYRNISLSATEGLMAMMLLHMLYLYMSIYDTPPYIYTPFVFNQRYW